MNGGVGSIPLEYAEKTLIKLVIGTAATCEQNIDVVTERENYHSSGFPDFPQILLFILGICLRI